MTLLNGSLVSLYYELLIMLNKIYIAVQKKIRIIKPHLSTHQIQSNVQIDILIPAIDKDSITLPLAIEAARKNIFHPVGKIYIIGTSDCIKEICSTCGCQFIDENTVLPINKNDIDYKVNGKDRSGWIFQQLLKLYGDSICESENFLVLDADTVLIRPTVFKVKNRTIFYFSDEFNVSYYRCFEKIFHRKIRSIKSYVSHMMLLDRKILEEMRHEIEVFHKKNWYEGVLDAIERNHMSAFSEFECYGNFFDQANSHASTHLYWHNKSLDLKEMKSLSLLEDKYSRKFRSLSFHVYP